MKTLTFPVARIIKFSLLLTSLFIGTSALADVTMKQKMSMTESGKTHQMEGTMYFQGKNMRMDIQAAQGSEMGPMGNMMVLANGTGHYACVEKSKTCNKMPGSFSAFSGQMPNPMKNEKVGQVTISKMGKKDRIAGFECTYYMVERDSQKSEGCYSTEAKAAFSKEILASGMESISKMAGSEAAKKSLMEVFELGIPLKYEQKMGGDSENMTMKSEVMSLKQGALAANMFEMPKGYKVMEMRQIMGAPGKGMPAGMPPEALKQLRNMKKNGNMPPEMLEQMKKMMPQGE